MTRRRPAFVPNPRVLQKHGTAARLGQCASTFDKKRPALEAEGFPHYDELLGGWDANAIEAWLDKRAGLSDSCDLVDADTEIDRWVASQCGTS